MHGCPLAFWQQKLSETAVESVKPSPNRYTLTRADSSFTFENDVSLDEVEGAPPPFPQSPPLLSLWHLVQFACIHKSADSPSPTHRSTHKYLFACTCLHQRSASALSGFSAIGGNSDVARGGGLGC